jgi:DNA repair exonuclease SbcCD ATPase subunit
MRIAQISDIHIRNLKFHQDYKKVFADFYRKLDELKPELVVNTGDTAHTKTNISPEFVDVTAEFFTEIAKRSRLINILGNHDLNLMNEDRQDAITPIVEALNSNKITLLKKSGPHRYNSGAVGVWETPFVFWNFGIADVENWPRAPYPTDSVNIGLFHGSIKNCVTDSLFRMTDVEYDTSIFQGLDFVMMGDIHKRQEFDNGRIWYAGSMIQQNFGEDPEKGFILWDIKSKDEWTVDFHELHGNRRFYTVYLPDSLTLPEQSIEPDSRIRISPQRPMTLVEQRAVEKLVRKKWNPYDVITLGTKNIGQIFAEIDGKSHRVENLRDVSVQEDLLKQYLEPRDLTEPVINKISDLNRKYQVAVEQKEAIARGVNWRVLKMGWNNLYNYGEGNVIDFSKIRGLTGIFAPNASGKSGLVDVITVGTWDCNTKEVQKNIHLVNDNKDRAAIILEMSANGERYTIQREIERLKYDKKKGNDKEWGKTTLDFYRHDKDGGLEKLVGELRPQTEANIARRFGTFDDFMLTGLFAQWDPMDLIMCKETERKRILFRFLDLDIFEDKAKLAKEDYKEWAQRLSDIEDNDYEKILTQIEQGQGEDELQLVGWNNIKAGIETMIADSHTKIEELASQIVPISFTFKKIEANVLSRFENDIQLHAKKLDKKVEEVKALQAEHASILEEMSGYSGEYVDKQVEKLEELEAVLFSVQAGVKERQRVVDEKKKQASLLEKVPCGDSFPDCQFLINAFQAQKELPEVLKESIEMDLEAQRLRSEILKLVPYRDAKEEQLSRAVKLNTIAGKLKVAQLESDNINLTIEKMETELREARLEVERYDRAKKELEHNDVIQHEIVEVKEALAESEKALKGLENQISELHQKMGSQRTDAERIKKQLETMKEVQDTCSAYEHFMDAMGKSGIALQVLTQKLPLINEEINKILSSAAEFGVYIEYQPDDQSIRLNIQYGQYKSRLLELGSGAEKFLASVAIRSALLSISNLPRSNMFIIDEGFGKLDPQNLEAVQRMFDYLKTVFDHVIVISHTDLMKDMVDNMIEITQDDEGYAHVEIGG